jgi:site-specific DNA-methyltransferase (adenine-specific)
VICPTANLGTTACKWDTIIPFEPLWEQYKRIIKDNGAIVLTASQPFTSALVMSNPDWFKCTWVWNKTKATNYVKARQMPMKYHEDILVFGKNKLVYNPQMEIGKPYVKKAVSVAKEGTVFIDTRKVGDININTGTRFPSSVIKISNDNHNSLHPTQKPVALFEYLIKTYTNEGDLVLDNCMGSGTTGVACKNLNRNFIGMELDPEYFKIAGKRINER